MSPSLVHVRFLAILALACCGVAQRPSLKKNPKQPVAFVDLKTGTVDLSGVDPSVVKEIGLNPAEVATSKISLSVLDSALSYKQLKSANRQAQGPAPAANSTVEVGSIQDKLRKALQTLAPKLVDNSIDTLISGATDRPQRLWTSISTPTRPVPTTAAPAGGQSFPPELAWLRQFLSLKSFDALKNPVEKSGLALDQFGCPKGIEPCKCKPNPNPAGGDPQLECSYISTPEELTLNPGLQNATPIRFSRISLLNSDLVFLPSKAFGSHYADEYFIHGNTRLEKIFEDAFAPQANPVSLIMHGNFLKTFPYEILRKMDNLKYFVAYDNQLEGIPEEAFAHTAGNIEEILLHDNRIVYIEQFPFRKLRKLNSVTLHNNHLTQLNPNSMFFTVPPQILTLNNNNIKTISADAFSRFMPEYINLSGNELEALDEGVWRHLFVSISPYAPNEFQSNKRIDFHDNAFLCNCEMAWFWKLRHEMYDVVHGVSCIETGTSIYQTQPIVWEGCL